jgi:hypothetical protein
MKYRPPAFLLFSLLITVVRPTIGQTFQNEVIASAGDFNYAENIQVSWTLGETIIECYSTENIILSQGFQQPFFLFSKVEPDNPSEFSVNTYPNPARYFVNIEFKGLEDVEDLRLELNNSMGANLIEKTISSDKVYKLEVSSFIDGMYFLRIIRLKNGKQSAFKIVVNNY